jgi:hypothetical protein
VRDDAPRVDDGVVESTRGETLVTPLDVPFGENARAWLRDRRHDKEPTQEIFPVQG